MNTDTIGRPHGNCGHTGTEYDGLTGYVTAQYTVNWQDTNGIRWRKVCTVINLGRPDRGIPADDVDAAMKPERLPLTPAKRPQKKGKRTAESYSFGKRVAGYLREHGMSSVLHIAQAMDVEQFRVLRHLKAFEGAHYTRVPINGKQSNWILMEVL